MRPRLGDDSLPPLEPELRALLDGVRALDARDPTYGDAACQRLLPRVEAAVRRAASRSRFDAQLWSVLPPRSSAIVALCLAAGLAAGIASRMDAPAAPVAARSPQTEQAETASSATPEVVPLVRIDDLPAASTVPEVRRRAPQPSTPAGGLAEEMRLIDAARVAELSKDHPDALRFAREHERRFPNGELAQERERVMIQVLVENRQGGRGASARELVPCSLPERAPPSRRGARPRRRG
jgi:hypothetical protein